MPERDSDLQRFVDALEQAVAVKSGAYPEVMGISGRIFSALKSVDTPRESNTSKQRLPVCSYIKEGLAAASRGPNPISVLADAFAAIEPGLVWCRRASANRADAAFWDNHANATIVGEGGLEMHTDVKVGVSLLAPDTVYPNHRHPPEEMYVVLSPGAWRQDERPWQSKKSGDLQHNPANIWHAMKSADEPLLAIWCLWLREA